MPKIKICKSCGRKENNHNVRHPFVERKENLNNIVNVGDILNINYSDGQENVKIVAIENGNIIIAKNYTSEIITDNDVAIAVLSDDDNVSKIKIKGVWLDYAVWLDRHVFD